jgi:hypothetical protein
VPERYELSTFLEYRSQLDPKYFEMESKLSSLMKRAQFPPAGHLDPGSSNGAAIPFYLNLETLTVSNVGRILLDLEMEIRRTTSYQLRASLVLPKHSQNMAIVMINKHDSLRIVMALSNELCLALTTQPIRFLINLDWFWYFRYSQSRVRSPVGQRNPLERWSHIFASASECTTSSHPVVAEMAICSQGATTLNFRTERSHS